LVLLGREREHLLRDGAVMALAMGAFATILCSCVFAAYYPQHGVAFMGVLVICVVFAASNYKRIVQALRGVPPRLSHRLSPRSGPAQVAAYPT
jgi:hypothetical protein